MININNLYIILNKATEDSKWYNSNIISAMIGAIVALVGSFMAIYISERNRKKDEIKNMIILITQNNKDLFNLIYKSSIDESNIDHTKFRSCLKDFHIVYLLPEELRKEFISLLNIYTLTGKEFSNVKGNVHIHCKKIIKITQKYGENLFG